MKQRLLEDMEPEMRGRYEELKLNNEKLVAELAAQQQQLERLKTQAAALHDKVSTSQVMSVRVQAEGS